MAPILFDPHVRPPQWLVFCLVALVGCGGVARPEQPGPTSAPASPQSSAFAADSASERALQLTHRLPQAYRDACARLLAYAPPGVEACPPVVPAGSLVVRSAGPVATSGGYEKSYVLDLASGSLDTIHGEPVETNGGHWTVSVAWGPVTKKLLNDQLHAALGVEPARCRDIRLADEAVEACRVPPTDDGYYSGHIAYAWEGSGVIYHITIHGHANEPRVAVMMEALIMASRG